MPYDAIRDPEQLHALLDAVLAVESDLELHGVIHRIAAAARSLTGARYAALGILDPSGKGLADFVQVGMDDETVRTIGHLPEGAGILGLLILDPHPLRLADLTMHPDSVGFPPGHPPMRSFIGAPLRIRGEVYGNLYVTEKIGAAEFSETDEMLAVELANIVGIAIDNARLHARVGELNLAADRERIARDLHDTVIQRLFATGLALQSTLPLAEDRALRARLEAAITDLDETIRQVRTTIFALDPPPIAKKSVRARVLDVCADAARALGFEPEVRFSGAIDAQVGPSDAAELLATLREALANVARHAKARQVEVELAVTGAARLRVVDDGVGFDGGRTGNGLPNMAERAERRGGSFSLAARPGGGSELVWQIPLAD